MASDRSRSIDRPHFGYNGVVAQQGARDVDRELSTRNKGWPPSAPPSTP